MQTTRQPASQTDRYTCTNYIYISLPTHLPTSIHTDITVVVESYPKYITLSVPSCFIRVGTFSLHNILGIMIVKPCWHSLTDPRRVFRPTGFRPIPIIILGTRSAAIHPTARGDPPVWHARCRGLRTVPEVDT